MLHKRKIHLVTKRNFVFHHSLKIDKWPEVPNKLRGGGGGGSEKNRKINKRPPRLLGT